MKKIIIGLLIVSLANVANAQIRRDANPNLNPNADTTQRISKKEMADELGLTKDQRVQWKQIHQNEKAQKTTIMSNDSLSADQKKMQLKDLHKQTTSSIEGILTPDQNSKWQALKQEAKESKMNNSNNAMPNNQPQQ